MKVTLDSMTVDITVGDATEAIVDHKVSHFVCTAGEICKIYHESSNAQWIVILVAELSDNQST